MSDQNENRNNDRSKSDKSKGDNNKMEMNGIVKKLFIKTDVKELQTVDLAECLELCRDILLKEISMSNNLETIPSTFNQQKRKMIRSQLIEKVPETFEEKLPYLLSEQRELLDRVIASEGIPEAELDPFSWDYLLAIGFLYVCFTGEEIYLYVPKELKEIYSDRKEQMKEIWQHYDQMWFYTKALLHLYGVYDVDWYTQVWNRHNKNKITQQEVEHYLNQLWNLQEEGWFSEGFFVSSYFESEQMLDDFLMATTDVPYYMPSKKDLLFYFDNPFVADPIYGNKLYQIFTDYRTQHPLCQTPPEQAVAVATWACIMDIEEIALLDQLERMGIQFQEVDMEKRFLMLLKGMSNNTRKWALCGWRPTDLIS